MQRFQNGAEDVQLTVRLAAVRAMGILGGPEAVRTLKEQIHDQSPKMRSQAAASLRILGEKETLFRLADDKASEVRLEVAKGLDNPRANQTGELVKMMLADPSAQVQKAAIEAVGHWPLEQSAPILFGEMKSKSLLKRETAAKTLGKHWEPALSFPYEERQPEILAKSLAALKDQFEFDDWDEEPGAIQQVSWQNHRELGSRELDRLSLDQGREAIATYTDPNATREERAEAREQMLALKGKFLFGYPD
jgi:HEAT repeat protein